MDDNTQTTAPSQSELSPVDRISALLQAESGAQPDDERAEQSSSEEGQEQPEGDETQEASDAQSDDDQAQDDDLEDFELDGKKYRVPKELKRGFLRQDDYTRKTQELAEERKVTQARMDNALKMVDSANKYQQQIGFIAAIDAELAQFDQATLLRLRSEDPQTYASRVADLQLLQQHRSNAVTALQQLQSQHDEAFRRELAMLRETNDRELSRRVKGWDSATSKAVEQYAMDYGFPKEQIEQAVDWRQREILWKAMEFDRLQKAKADATKKVVKPVGSVRPGSSPGQQSQSAIASKNADRERLRKTGSMADAARAIKGLL